MKAIFIAFDQAYYETITEALLRNGCRGFTAWEQVQGRGTNGGEPRRGTHAWPEMNSCMITIVEDNQVDDLLEGIRKLDMRNPAVGVRAFVWNVEQTV